MLLEGILLTMYLLLYLVWFVVLFWMVLMNKKKVKTAAKKSVDLGTNAKLTEIVNKWRPIIGVDPVYIINLKIGITEDPSFADNPAWIDGLSSDNTHPAASLYINATWLEQNRSNEYDINYYIVHELCHIIVFEAFVMANPAYKYEGLQARANETLVMKMTSAIMHAYQA